MDRMYLRGGLRAGRRPSRRLQRKRAKRPGLFQPDNRREGRLQRQMASVIQRAVLARDRLNIAGERHPESNVRRGREKSVCLAKTGSGNYWQEHEFARASDSSLPADPRTLRYEHLLQLGRALPIHARAAVKKSDYLDDLEYAEFGKLDLIRDTLNQFRAGDIFALAMKIYPFDLLEEAVWIEGLHRIILLHCQKARTEVQRCKALATSGQTLDVGQLQSLVRASKPLDTSLDQITQGLDELDKALERAKQKYSLDTRDISNERSDKMHAAGQNRSGEHGVWKVGQEHAEDMAGKGGRRYNLLSRDEFNRELDG